MLVWLRMQLQKIVRVRTPVALLCATLFVIGSGYGIHWIEPEKFVDPFTGIWYVMTTVTTVGYGDYAPSTVLGRLLGMFLFIFGVAFVGIVIGKLIDAMLAIQRRKEEGLLSFTGKGHVLMIGWSAKAMCAIEEMLASPQRLPIVVIDTLPKTPIDNPHVHYIQGDPTDESTLHRASVTTAKAVILFADDRLTDTTLIDGKSLLIATAIERIAPHVFTIVELLLEKHRRNFQHVQVNEFILSHETISHMAVRSALSTTAAPILQQLLSAQDGDNLHDILPVPEWKTYREAFQALLSMGATLLSDRGNLGINRTLDAPLPADALLTIVCDDTTFKKIQEELL